MSFPSPQFGSDPLSLLTKTHSVLLFFVFLSFALLRFLNKLGETKAQPPLVSLAETYELLRVLEEVTAPIELSGSAYLDDDDDDGGEDSSESPVDIFGDLDMLGRLLEGHQEKEQPTRTSTLRGGERTKRALMQLEIVRGALAR